MKQWKKLKKEKRYLRKAQSDPAIFQPRSLGLNMDVEDAQAGRRDRGDLRAVLGVGQTVRRPADAVLPFLAAPQCQLLQSPTRWKQSAQQKA